MKPRMIKGSIGFGEPGPREEHYASSMMITTMGCWIKSGSNGVFPTQVTQASGYSSVPRSG